MTKLNWARVAVQRRIKQSGSMPFFAERISTSIEPATEKFNLERELRNLEEALEDWIFRSSKEKIKAWLMAMNEVELKLLDFFLQRIALRQKRTIHRVEKFARQLGKPKRRRSKKPRS
jgi:hypothetical protein